MKKTIFAFLTVLFVFGLSDCDGMLTLNGESVVTLTEGHYYRDPEIESEYSH